MQVGTARSSTNEDDAVSTFQQRIEQRTGTCLSSVRANVLDAGDVARNIEYFVGAAQVPLGIAGPIEVHGEFAEGRFYVPFATTEGTLVEGYSHGMLLITRSGGATARVLSRRVDITPVFELPDLPAATAFSQWLEGRFGWVKTACESTTQHSRLIELKPVIIGRRVYVHFAFDSRDCMGLNTISLATDKACREILGEYPQVVRFHLRSNLSADKKAAYSNFIHGYGKEVVAECVIGKSVVGKYLQAEPSELADFWHASVLSGFQAGTVGHNAHYANALAAIYIACGQDVAQIVNAASGVSSCELLPDGDLYFSVRLPCLILGTVGGGTGLPTQSECLALLGCQGDDKSDKFAEIVAATLLAGEISICGGLATGGFIEAHRRKRRAR